MAVEDLFDHTCNIFHLRSAETSPGFGLPASPKFEYDKAPDLEGVACHFHVNNFAPSFREQQPHTDMEATEKLSLPVGTDVRINDKIVDLTTGVEYTAGVPRNIRDHHIAVQLHRTTAQRAL